MARKKLASTVIIFLVAVMCVTAAMFAVKDDINFKDVFPDNTTTTQATTTEPTALQEKLHAPILR